MYRIGLILVTVLGLLVMQACTEKPAPGQTGQDPAGDVTPKPAAQSGGTQYCDFKGGPEDAKVRVVAFYPGRHEDTLAAVKSLLETFPDKVQVEFVDWRREEGLKRRDATGLTCAGVMINDKNAFDLVVGGEKTKVLFVRGIDGEWTKADLEAAVRQCLASAEGASTE